MSPRLGNFPEAVGSGQWSRGCLLPWLIGAHPWTHGGYLGRFWLSFHPHALEAIIAVSYKLILNMCLIRKMEDFEFDNPEFELWPDRWRLHGLWHSIWPDKWGLHRLWHSIRWLNAHCGATDKSRNYSYQCFAATRDAPNRGRWLTPALGWHVTGFELPSGWSRLKAHPPSTWWILKQEGPCCAAL